MKLSEIIDRDPDLFSLESFGKSGSDKTGWALSPELKLYLWKYVLSAKESARRVSRN